MFTEPMNPQQFNYLLTNSSKTSMHAANSYSVPSSWSSPTLIRTLTLLSSPATTSHITWLQEWSPMTCSSWIASSGKLSMEWLMLEIAPGPLELLKIIGSDPVETPEVLESAAKKPSSLFGPPTEKSSVITDPLLPTGRLLTPPDVICISSINK